MVLQRKRHLLVGLGLSVALVLAVALPATASAVSTLTGETLRGGGLGGSPPDCSTGTLLSVSGNATGPYAGPFTETGTWTLSPPIFSANFTITSGTTTITGSKSGSQFQISCGSRTDLNASVPYTATIHTPDGNFHDEGTATVSGFTSTGRAELTETFTSSLAHASPTSKDQCKNGGWQNLPQFKNQGQCVSFVERQSRT
jgi:hypothetical protein